MDRVGEPGQQGGAGRRRVAGSPRPGGQPAVHRQQPGQRDHREDRVGHRVLAVEERGGHQRRDHGHAVGGRAVKSEPAAGQEAERHHQGADHRVDRQDGVVHTDGVLGEPVNRRDQQRVATLVQRRTGEVHARPARQHPRRDQVRGLVRVGQGSDLPAAEPHPQPGLDQPPEPEQQAPPPRRSPRGAGPHGAGRHGVGQRGARRRGVGRRGVGPRGARRRGARRHGAGLCRAGRRGAGQEGGDVSRISDGGHDQRARQGCHSFAVEEWLGLGPRASRRTSMSLQRARCWCACDQRGRSV